MAWSKEEKRKYMRQYMLKYNKKHRKKVRKYKNEKEKEYRKKNNNKHAKKWQSKNKFKIKVHKIFWNTKGSHQKKQPCKICRNNKKVVAHHPNYSQPLRVIWLCRSHHREFHYKNIRKIIYG